MPQKKSSNKKDEYHRLRWIVASLGILIFGYFLLKLINFYIPKDGQVKPQYVTYQTEYVSDRNGYSISYPKDWTINTSSGVPADIIKNKDNKINIAIQRLAGDSRLLSRKGITAVMKEMKDSYSAKTYTLNSIEGALWKGLPVLLATGTFTEEKVVWNFEEYSIFFGVEIYNLRANWKNDNEKKVIQPIIASFKINGYDNRDDEGANKALASVLDISEVRNFQKDVLYNNQSKFSIFIDSSPTVEELYYVVVVAEFFPDHRTTFNRYKISRDDRKVYRYDVTKDSWDRL